MAASGGSLYHLMVKNYGLIKIAWHKSRNHLLQSLRVARGELELVPIRNVARQPLHSIAALKQQRSGSYGSRPFSTVSRFAASLAREPSTRTHRALPSSRTASVLARSNGRAPFASTLRPNLTAGAFTRSSGGYSLGSGRVGGVRYFSHGPANPCDVIHNVSQAVRAFGFSGYKAQYCGRNKRGEKRFKAVSTLQHEATRRLKCLPKATPGSYVEFAVNPTITAITPLRHVAGYETSDTLDQTVNSRGLLDVLSADFSRALKDLSVILGDLSRLSTLGDLGISYEQPGLLRVHFPGCDSDTVEKLCDEFGVQRGVVFQDDSFDIYAGTEIALLFPFAPDYQHSGVDNDSNLISSLESNHQFRNPLEQGSIRWFSMLDTTSVTLSARTDAFYTTDVDRSHEIDNGVLFSGLNSESYASHSSDQQSDSKSHETPLEFHDFEGIYRFIELCDSARHQHI